MFDRRLVQNFDWGLLGLIFALAGVGLVALYSAVNAGAASHESALFTKQMIWYAVGFGVMTVCFLVNYKALDKLGPAIYVTTLILLVAVLFFGKMGGGARRWLMLGPISIQPSEIAKLTIIITLALYYAKVPTAAGYTLRELIKPVALVAVPFILILRQPDLGTALHLGLIAGTMTVFVKIERRSSLAILTSGMLIGPIVWGVLKGYQKQRILTFLNPDRDPLGAGYHIIQSKIAIGSGMLTGKGFLKGTQNALSFLPEQHTDFIFSVLAEEWGLVGTLVVLVVFLLLLIWGLQAAYGCRDLFGMLLCIGVTSMIFWQVVINIGMVMGLLPVVGVPLPFVSYGGSSIVTMMACMGLLMNIRMRRYLFE